MISIFKKSPVAKEKGLGFRITISAFAFICSIFVLSPVIVSLITKSNPLSEMPDSSLYYILRALFGISLIVTSIIYAITRKIVYTAIPALLGLVTSIFPLIYRIDKYKEYKKVIEIFSMTADYTPYIINICLYVLFILLCLSYIIYALGVLKMNIVVSVFSVLSSIAVVFLTVDRSKTVEFGIFNTFDILSFAYISLASLIPFMIIFTVKKKQSIVTKESYITKAKYQPRRMK